MDFFTAFIAKATPYKQCLLLDIYFIPKKICSSIIINSRFVSNKLVCSLFSCATDTIMHLLYSILRYIVTLERFLVLIDLFTMSASLSVVLVEFLKVKNGK